MDCWISSSWFAAPASLSPLQSVKIDEDDVDKEEDDKDEEDDEDDKDKEDDEDRKDKVDDEDEFLFSPQLDSPLACTHKSLSQPVKSELE